MAVHGAAAVAEVAILWQGQNTVARTLSHVHDILAECILGSGSADAS
jgi:hypothetical protein